MLKSSICRINKCLLLTTPFFVAITIPLILEPQNLPEWLLSYYVYLFFMTSGSSIFVLCLATIFLASFLVLPSQTPLIHWIDLSSLCPVSFFLQSILCIEVALSFCTANHLMGIQGMGKC